MHGGTLLVDRELSTHDAAKVLDLHPHTVLKYFKTSRVPGAYEKFGRWFIDSETLREFVTSDEFAVSDKCRERALTELHKLIHT